MNTNCQKNLVEIKHLISLLSDQQYTHQSKLLSEATIGQHVRHILEFYQSIFNGLDAKIINYDNRKRNLLIENNREFAIQTIGNITKKLTHNFSNSLCILEGNFCSDEGNKIQIKTTFQRELAYCLEHSIHHQALIKVGLIELKCESLINNTFGLAPATIRFKKAHAN